MSQQEATDILSGRQTGATPEQQVLARQTFYDAGADVEGSYASQAGVGTTPQPTAPSTTYGEPYGGGALNIAAQNAPAASGRQVGGNSLFQGFQMPTVQELTDYGFDPNTSAGVYKQLQGGVSPYNIRELDPWSGNLHYEFALPGQEIPLQPNLMGVPLGENMAPDWANAAWTGAPGTAPQTGTFGPGMTPWSGANRDLTGTMYDPAQDAQFQAGLADRPPQTPGGVGGGPGGGGQYGIPFGEPGSPFGGGGYLGGSPYGGFGAPGGFGGFGGGMGLPWGGGFGGGFPGGGFGGFSGYGGYQNPWMGGGGMMGVGNMLNQVQALRSGFGLGGGWNPQSGFGGGFGMSPGGWSQAPWNSFGGGYGNMWGNGMWGGGQQAQNFNPNQGAWNRPPAMNNANRTNYFPRFQ
jgi:hypothetical protein